MDVSVLQEYDCYITPGVLSEIKNNLSKQKLETAILSGNLTILSPDPDAIKEVRVMAKSSGDLQFLSTTDIGVIALALALQTKISQQDEIPFAEVPIEVVTDDYSIQNVLSKFSISANSFISLKLLVLLNLI